MLKGYMKSFSDELLINCHLSKRIKRSFLVSLFLIICVSIAFSQTGNNSLNFPGNYFVKQFTVDEGLSQHLVSSIHQNWDGFAWLKLVNNFQREQGINSDGIWHDKEVLLIIMVAGTWWQQILLYLIFLVIAIGILLSIRQYELNRIRLRNHVRIANIEILKLKELDQLKSQFFANISHEFRTPLTLITGPLEQLIEEEKDMHKKNSMMIMLSNASRLLQLVNQLLDLSKLENDYYNIKACKGDIAGFIKGVTMSFSTTAEQKKIDLRIEDNIGNYMDELSYDFYFDPDIMEKIMNNLLSNAFKFTPENGKVSVKICLLNDKKDEEFLEIVIADTGIGIPADKLPYIYDRFYQVYPSSKKENEGSGIGLAYVKELVRVHKGEVRVKSRPGAGTTFSLRFPVGKAHLNKDQVIDNPGSDLSVQLVSEDNILTYSETKSYETENNNHEKPWVLIVEDHAQVSHFIAEIIQKEFRPIQTSNAFEGYKIAEEAIPDLIISDIMMKEMDGYEFCKKVKASEKTSHIPVILLTARADKRDKIRGLETGADDYLTKPFNGRELLIRVRNLIDSRRNLREKFNSHSVINTGEISVTSRDAHFMKKLLSIVEKNIDNYTFSVEELGREAGMSQSQIHRKLRALINMPANHFIRSVRMHHALELLQKNAGNISEIAYMVGYDDPGYFTKSFRAFFGKLPSEVNKKTPLTSSS